MSAGATFTAGALLARQVPHYSDNCFHAQWDVETSCGGLVAEVDGERYARLFAAAPDLLSEMERYRVILERAESLPNVWGFLTRGTGIATVNGYRAAIAKATTASTD